MTRNPGARDNLQVLTRQFEGRDDPDVGGAAGQLVGAAGRHPEFEVEEALLGTVEDTPD